MIQRKIVFPALFCILLAGCSLFSRNGSSSKSNKEKLEINRHIWLKEDAANYQFNLFISCYCAFEVNPAIIVVRDDTVNTVINPKTGKIFTPSDSNRAREKYADFPTVDELFKTIEQAIKRDPYRLKVKYNPHYGYPEQIDVDYDKNIADDEFHYQVSDFKLAEPAE
jgi:hypothetical protein